MVTALFQHNLFCDIFSKAMNEGNVIKKHLSGISDLGRAKYVVVVINNAFLH